MLAGGTVLAATAALDSDAALVALATEYLTLDVEIQRINAACKTGAAWDDHVDRVLNRSNRCLDEVTEMVAQTAAGWRAKAAVLATAIRADIGHPQREHYLAVSLACDLLGHDRSEYLT